MQFPVTEHVAKPGAAHHRLPRLRNLKTGR